MPAKVAINGYGTIGKRVADAVSLQGDMEIVGVSKMTPNFEAAYEAKLREPRLPPPEEVMMMRPLRSLLTK